VKYGYIEICNIKTDNKGRSLEQAFVRYRDKNSAKRAMQELHGTLKLSRSRSDADLDGRIISVEEVTESDPSKSFAQKKRVQYGVERTARVLSKRIFKPRQRSFQPL